MLKKILEKLAKPQKIKTCAADLPEPPDSAPAVDLQTVLNCAVSAALEEARRNVRTVSRLPEPEASAAVFALASKRGTTSQQIVANMQQATSDKLLAILDQLPGLGLEDRWRGAE